VLFSFFNKKPEISGNSLSKVSWSPLFSHRNKYQGLWKNIISAAINLVEPPWWPLIKGHFALHENMIPTFLFIRIALLHDA